MKLFKLRVHEIGGVEFLIQSCTFNIIMLRKLDTEHILSMISYKCVENKATTLLPDVLNRLYSNIYKHLLFSGKRTVGPLRP